MTDKERIDWLEKFINEQGGILLHDGNGTSKYPGLGLRPGALNRSLRQAIDRAANPPSGRRQKDGAR